MPFRYPRTIADLGALRRALADLSHLPDSTALFVRDSSPDRMLTEPRLALTEEDGPEAPAFLTFDDYSYAYLDQPDDWKNPNLGAHK